MRATQTHVSPADIADAREATRRAIDENERDIAAMRERAEREAKEINARRAAERAADLIKALARFEPRPIVVKMDD
jgi:glycerol-3-phosphate O-acyltransferase